MLIVFKINMEPCRHDAQYPEDKNAVMVNEELYAVPEQKEEKGGGGER